MEYYARGRGRIAKKYRSFLAFTENYGILILLVVRRMDRAPGGQAIGGAFDAAAAPPDTGTDDLKRGNLP